MRVETATAHHELQRRESDMHDLIRAVKALTCDAEMRCALDEREIEFRAAPSHIYGRHGYENNGSKSERTAYPAGDFKLAVRHGGEGNARDVIERRKKWLNSITSSDSAPSSTRRRTRSPPARRRVSMCRSDSRDRRDAPQGTSPRPDSPSATAAGSVGGSTLLGPAHAFLSRHPMPPGQQVGLAPSIATPTLAPHYHPSPQPLPSRDRDPGLDRDRDGYS